MLTENVEPLSRPGKIELASNIFTDLCVVGIQIQSCHPSLVADSYKMYAPKHRCVSGKSLGGSGLREKARHSLEHLNTPARPSTTLNLWKMHWYTLAGWQIAEGLLGKEYTDELNEEQTLKLLQKRAKLPSFVQFWLGQQGLRQQNPQRFALVQIISLVEIDDTAMMVSVTERYSEEKITFHIQPYHLLDRVIDTKGSFVLVPSLPQN